jgi:hypothetical protein
MLAPAPRKVTEESGAAGIGCAAGFPSSATGWFRNQFMKP